MVVIGSSVLLAVGAALAVSADAPTTGPNEQTLGVALMLVALTVLVAAFTMRDPAGRK